MLEIALLRPPASSWKPTEALIASLLSGKEGDAVRGHGVVTEDNVENESSWAPVV